jgi:hypothetical protein
VLVPGEWNPTKFEMFQAKLMTDVNLVAGAITASSSSEADRLWKRAFGD